MISIYDSIGLLGISFSLFSYARVQWRRDYAKTVSYSLLNLISALFLGISLIQNWNLAAFVSNLLWGLMSIYGLHRCFKYIRRERLEAKKQP
jgi:hypothetical protein